MKLLIISNAPIIKKDNSYFAYSPYVSEMEIWAKHADELALCCPEWKQENRLLISRVSFTISKIFLLSDFNVISLPSIFKSFFQIIYNLIIIFKALMWADHIHLRCPGNIGLVGSVAQIFFPSKVKTAKYAGNWDPKSKQPLTYKLQKWIVSNTFLTKNIQVLVYGNWENSTKNIKPFFTATYSETDIKSIPQRNFDNTIRFVFVGTLVEGKNPMYALELVALLLKKGYKVSLAIYGDGIQKTEILNYIKNNNLESEVRLYGNQCAATLKKAYQESHFVILPSESEGWPKAIAEGMFWGCVPIVTTVSCVPYMLDYGKRGLFLSKNTQTDVLEIEKLLNDVSEFNKKSKRASDWSQQYTLEVFEKEIKQLLLS